MDSNKIEAIEIVYHGFLKSLLEVWKTMNPSIMLVEFNNFFFEHFTWGQALLYYNRVSTVIKDRILGKAWKKCCCKKEMLGSIREKMVTLESAPKGGRFSASGSTTTRNGTSACNDPCTPRGDCSTSIKNGSWDNAHTSNLSSRGKTLSKEPNTLVQRA